MAVNRVDEKATKAARAQQQEGIELLNRYFGYMDSMAPFVPQTGRAFPVKKVRRMFRSWRDETFPRRVKTRRRRKIANASRRRNRT